VGKFYWTWVLAAFFFGDYLYYIYGTHLSAGHGNGDWQGPSLVWFREVSLGGIATLALGTILAIPYAPIAWMMAYVTKIERKPDTKLNFLFVFTATSLPFILLILVLAFG